MDATDAGADPMHELGNLRMRSFRAGDAHVVELAGVFDAVAAPAVEAELTRVEAGDARMVVLDLRRLTFMGSSGLQVVVPAHRRLAERLVVVKGPRNVQRMFELCDTATPLPFADEPPPHATPAGAMTTEGSPDGAVMARRRAAAIVRAEQGALAVAVRELRSRNRARPLR
jgi:anti-sigma B factor antagonist